jgi:23S rRNA pseudouridine2604 synthase
MRINKFLSKAGFCSRRQADDYINNGRVLINGTIAQLGDQVSTEDVVMVNGEIIELTENNIYLAFNKPVGITTTTAEHDDSNIIDYIEYGERIFPIGRLDKDSHGLILLTNDGDVVNKILRSRYDHEKEYVVKVNKRLTHRFIDQLEKGVVIERQNLPPAKN